MAETISPGRQIAAVLQSADFQSKIGQALPPGMSEDRFTRAVITAIQANPSIVEGDKQSLYSSIVQSAHAGLHLDGKEAALVIFNTNVGTKDKPRWIKKVQFMPMIAGVIKRLGGAGVTVMAEVVYANDYFEVQYGDDPKILHRPPKFGEPRGDGIGAYAICRAKDGQVYREVMDKAQIDAVQAQSRSKNSLMWTNFWTEAWRKTVLRRCAKHIPIEDALYQKTVEADNSTFNMDEEIPAVDPETVVDEQYPDEEPVVEQPQQPAPKPARPKALQAVVEQRRQEATLDEPQDYEGEF